MLRFLQLCCVSKETFNCKIIDETNIEASRVRAFVLARGEKTHIYSVPYIVVYPPFVETPAIFQSDLAASASITRPSSHYRVGRHENARFVFSVSD